MVIASYLAKINIAEKKTKFKKIRLKIT